MSRHFRSRPTHTCCQWCAPALIALFAVVDVWLIGWLLLQLSRMFR